ncbi:hypothetical protein MKW94_012008 [Papaver nudicaule]|uniref:Uncharacterized protein n=1 Tax=Papaver nudicaule TaxID=74823 RepID=A0AA42AUQ4_PAPNU|nr:hypothetical protein [Papaver nudicaule]
MLLVNVQVTYQSQTILIDVPIQVHQQVILGAPSQYLPRTPEENLVDVLIQEDVPVQLQTFGSSSTVLGRRPREEDNSLFDVLVQEDFTVDVPVLFQTCCVPSSSTVLGKRPHEENNEILRAPLGTFNASASTSGTTKKPRKCRSRRARFTPITLPKSPEIRAAIRAMYAAHKRVTRNRDRAT